MNILFDINHPAHVHLFRNAIQILKQQGHTIVVTARDKDVTLPLLDHYQIPYRCLSRAKKGMAGLGIELFQRQMQLLPILLKNKIQICVSVTGACSVHVAKLLGIPSLIFYDTEHAKLQNSIANPFATAVVTPSAYWGNIGKNHIRYNGVHDLAYLHPKYFEPNPGILKKLNLRPGQPYVLMRFVAWGAAHDRGHSGISSEMKRQLIGKLTALAKIFIVSEAPLEKEFEPYRLTLAPWEVLDALAYATLYLGEGGSMATEAALQGTPSIFVSTLNAGVFEEYQKKYGLMFVFRPDQQAEIFNTIEYLFRDEQLKEKWRQRRQKFLDEKIDVTEFMVQTILSYARKN